MLRRELSSFRRPPLRCCSERQPPPSPLKEWLFSFASLVYLLLARSGHQRETNVQHEEMPEPRGREPRTLTQPTGLLLRMPSQRYPNWQVLVSAPWQSKVDVPPPPKPKATRTRGILTGCPLQTFFSMIPDSQLYKIVQSQSSQRKPYICVSDQVSSQASTGSR
ncbi:hypothetical protein EV126DRAFT_198085 [Verticillium dahliae]|nr:hypothetical protein EV126DRAFT_198085 [Verticillium dahliae]